MPKNAGPIAIASVLIVLAIGVFVFAFRGNLDSSQLSNQKGSVSAPDTVNNGFSNTDPNDSGRTNTQVDNTNPSSNDSVGAQIHDYSNSNYQNAIASDKLVVLYFYANWCPICRAEFPMMEEAFKSLPGDDVVGIRVNFKDTMTDKDEEELAKQFDVPYQHYKVFFRDGNEILSSPESWSKERYIEEISNLI